jgi:4-alpha-glucanotransferase
MVRAKVRLMDPRIEPLHALAAAAGVQREWRDVTGHNVVVADAQIEKVLSALGHDTESDLGIARALAQLKSRHRELPALATADVGGRIALPFACNRASATGDDGRTQLLRLENGVAIAPNYPGYYDFEVDDKVLRLAVAPLACPTPETSERHPWGAAVQIPSLRGSTERAFGNLADLAAAVETLASRGADAVAINPLHALFPGNGQRFSPYSPSSRTWLNAAMGDPALAGLPPLPTGKADPLIDWPRALPARQRQLRKLWDSLTADQRAPIEAELAQQGEGVRRHALFDALDRHFRPHGAHGWLDWPVEFQDPDSAAVASFAAQNPDEVNFQRFAQWLTRSGIDEVQRRAKAAGMSIGLIGDLAVGVDPGGSDCWGLRSIMLNNLTIGAPPDPLGPHGQNWALTTFSPEGLRSSGYAPFIAMLRTAFAGHGGLRIDHAFGLARLWVIPPGCDPTEGAYLAYPFADLIRLVTLEAYLAGALVIAEDLGTAPPGFTHAITARRMLGMRVLWFERAADHGFIGAQDYPEQSVAMTGTHDTATVAGWWSGTDLDWAERLGRLPEGVARTEADSIRDWDRGLLWSTLSGTHPRPAPTDAEPVVDAAIDHVARASSTLAIVPLEDLLGQTEQPNLPGTIAEHPNWRRRLIEQTDHLLGQPAANARMKKLTEGRAG